MKTFLLISCLVLLCSESAIAFPQNEKPAPLADVAAMKLQLAKLQETFGKDHPKVVELKKRIGLVTRLNSLIGDSPRTQSMMAKIQPLMLEEQELLSKYGPDHPKVESIRARIRFIADFYSKKTATSAPSQEKNNKGNGGTKPQSASDKSQQAVKTLLPLLQKEQELIAVYGEKHPRVVRLRKQIAELQKQIPQREKRTGGRGPARGNIPQPQPVNSPVVSNDPSPSRYAMEKKDGQIVLLDRKSGKTWILKTGNGAPRWIPVKGGANER